MNHDKEYQTCKVICKTCKIVLYLIEDSTKVTWEVSCPYDCDIVNGQKVKDTTKKF